MGRGSWQQQAGGHAGRHAGDSRQERRHCGVFNFSHSCCGMLCCAAWHHMQVTERGQYGFKGVWPTGGGIAFLFASIQYIWPSLCAAPQQQAGLTGLLCVALLAAGCRLCCAGPRKGTLGAQHTLFQGPVLMRHTIDAYDTRGFANITGAVAVAVAGRGRAKQRRGLSPCRATLRLLQPFMHLCLPIYPLASCLPPCSGVRRACGPGPLPRHCAPALPLQEQAAASGVQGDPHLHGPPGQQLGAG